MTKTDLPDVPIAIVHRPGQELGVTLPASAFLRLVALAREATKRAVEVPADDGRVADVDAEVIAYPDLHPDLVAVHDLDTVIHEIEQRLADVVGPVAWAEVGEHGEEMADRVEIAMARRSDVETVPHALVKRLIAGDHPVKVYREHRRLTQAALAERTGLSPMYLSQIETGRRGGSTKTLRKMARALRVDLDDLARWDEDAETATEEPTGQSPKPSAPKSKSTRMA